MNLTESRLWNALTSSLRRIPPGLLLFLWGLLILLPFLGLRPLWLPDEGRYAEVAREMIVSHDWLSPQLNFLPHFTKPPLTYWFAASSMNTFGLNEFAARLMGALALAGTAVLVYYLAREMGRRRSAFMAGVVFLTSLLPFIAGNIVTTDMQLAFWETLAVLLFWRRFNRSPGEKGALVGGYAALGMAFMTKGPVGILIPFLAIAGYSLYYRDLTFLRRLFSPLGIALFCLVAFPWYIAVSVVHPGLMNYFLGNEVAGRMLTTVHHRNNTFLIYPLVAILGMLPWTGYLFQALRRSFPWKEIRQMKIPPAETFLASWILLPLIFFCLVKSRLPLYILGLFVPMAILAAARLYPEPESADQNPKVKPRKAPVYIAAVISVLLPALSLAAAFYPTASDLSPLTRDINRLGNGNDYHLYSTDKSLYTLLFYTGKPCIVIPDAAPFLADSTSAFLVTRRDIPVNPPGDILFVSRHFKYRLYYHSGNKNGQTAGNSR